MDRSKTQKKLDRVVWRMSEAHPQGEWVQTSARRPPATLPSERHERGFSQSSLDLLCGVDVSEAAMDTLPGELTDGFTSSMAADVDNGAGVDHHPKHR